MNAAAMYDVVQTQSEGGPVRGRGCGRGHCGEGTETVDREHPIFISHNVHHVVPQMVRRTIT